MDDAATIARIRQVVCRQGYLAGAVDCAEQSAGGVLAAIAPAPDPLKDEQRVALNRYRAAVEAEHHAEQAVQAARNHRNATYRQLIAAMQQGGARS